MPFFHVTPNHDVVPFVSLEVILAISRHRLAETFAHIDAVHLAPEVYQSVRRRCPGETDNAAYGRAGYAHSLEALGF